MIDLQETFDGTFPFSPHTFDGHGFENLAALVEHLGLADFRAVWPDAPVVELPGVGHFCQEDAPDVLVSNIHQFIQATP